MAGAITGLFSSLYGAEKPTIVIVEPNAADCLFRTARAHDGKLHPVTGSMRTIMAGLACGEPCSIGWQVLKDYADFFISCPDYAAAQGMRILGNPAGQDQRVVSGESGAAAFGAVSEILRDPTLRSLKEASAGPGFSAPVLQYGRGDGPGKLSTHRLGWNLSKKIIPINYRRKIK